MRNKYLFAFAFVGILIAAPVRAATVQSLGNFIPYGIDGNNIVGTGVGGSYIYNSITQAYTPVAFPGASSTYAYGVSGNTIVGAYRTAGGAYHGFAYDGLTWTTLDDPLAGHSAIPQGTIARAVSAGDIVGEYVDASNKAHAFLYNGTTWTTIDDPIGTQSAAYGVSGGNIVGGYSDVGGNLHGFVYNGTSWVTINDQATPNLTYLAGITGNAIVGGGALRGHRLMSDLCTICTPAPISIR